ncbi:hypothetical protein [Pontibacter mangrovi]|uniref:Uncharacterized protein n=1 Tax=Pontibacter mangrovi TaxID=2589816 RepID=A0A501W7D0_9BACT|nr:hypothetical protein [Pontibacter mangrovi]TPE45489.1 hypothetical protein FJM65_05550 [Pontibacter mangrovi]
MPVAAVLLLSVFAAPLPQAYAENSNGTLAKSSTAATTQQVAQAQPAQKGDQAKPQATATKPDQKSVLDAEVLESPLEYLRNAFTSEEEETDTSSGSGMVMHTLKALVATLLSTVM